MYRKYCKRFIGIVGSLIALIVLSPVFLILAVLVFIKLGRPIIFYQDRPGFRCEIFRLYKFKTMTDQRGTDGNLLPDEERLTNFGRWLRSTSLDEIPEFWNILRGDMSFVGPRPLLIEYLPYYTSDENKRHEVKPGLTGLAQVAGRNSLQWEDRFKYDIQYVNNVSLKMDISIILKTVSVVLRRDGIGRAEVDFENFANYRKKQYIDNNKDVIL